MDNLEKHINNIDKVLSKLNEPNKNYAIQEIVTSLLNKLDARHDEMLKNNELSVISQINDKEE